MYKLLYVMENAEINTKKLFLLHSLQFLTSLWNGTGYGAPFRHALSARTAIVLLTILTRFASIVLWFAAWFFLHCINTTSCKLGNLLPHFHNLEILRFWEKADFLVKLSMFPCKIVKAQFEKQIGKNCYTITDANILIRIQIVIICCRQLSLVF